MFATLDHRLKHANAKYGAIAGITLILLWALLAPRFGNCWDFCVAFRQAALSGDYSGYVYSPYPMYWLIWPFAILPVGLGIVLWNLANAAGFIFALRHWKANILAFSISLPCFWIFYSGQIEGLLAAGIVLALSGGPLVAGIGITLLTFKPQVGLLAILFVLLRRRDWRLFIVPAVVYLASFLYWGWWIPDWLDAVVGKGGSAPVAMTNVSLFPYALLLLPLLWRYRSSLRIWLLVESLVMPYFPVYSLSPYFTIQAPAVWLNLFMWALYLSALWIRYPISPGFIIPLSLLVQLLLLKRREQPALAS